MNPQGLFESMGLSSDAGLSSAFAYACAHDPEPAHAVQVCRVSLYLFDCTQALHAMGEHERRLLAAAALLHDIGWPVRPDAHHKGSRDLILAAELPGVPDEEKRVLACIARYHRKAHPDGKHKVYRDLDAESQRTVTRLAAILRIADGLDRSHCAAAEGLRAEYLGDTVRVHVVQREANATDLWGAARKQQLFEEEFRVTLTLVPETRDTL